MNGATPGAAASGSTDAIQTPVLEVDRLTKHFPIRRGVVLNRVVGQVRAVDDVSFSVAPHAGEVTAFDLSADMLAAVEKEAAARDLANITTHQGSVEKLPFIDGAFDFVASRYSAHHWHNIAAGLKEARRVLKPGGVAVFADSVSPGDHLLDTHLQAIELLRDSSHVRDYVVAEWESLLRRAGFTPGKPVVRRVRLELRAWRRPKATSAPSARYKAACRAMWPITSPWKPTAPSPSTP